jgi:ABC-type Fe3+ transport system substrate-binding protein
MHRSSPGRWTRHLPRYVGLAAIAAATLLVACQPAGRGSPPPAGATAAAPAQSGAGDAPGAPPTEVERLLAAAAQQGEDELIVSWGNSLGGGEGIRRFEALFNRMYGTSIRIQYTPGPSMADMAAKIAQEAAAGHAASTDLLIGNVEDHALLLNRDVLEAYDYGKLSTRIRPEMLTPVGIELWATSPGTVYNTDLVAPADVPRKLEDMLHPRWSGKLTSRGDGTTFELIAMRPEWGAEKMKAYVTRLSPQISGLIRASESGRVASGEFAMLVIGSRDEATRLKTRGAPVDITVPEDAAIVRTAYGAVPRTARHPNLSKLFMHAILGEEGQRLGYELTYADHYLLPGSQSAAAFGDLRARGVEPLRVDAKFMVEHPELRVLAEDLMRILRDGRPG